MSVLYYTGGTSGGCGLIVGRRGVGGGRGGVAGSHKRAANECTNCRSGTGETPIIIVAVVVVVVVPAAPAERPRTGANGYSAVQLKFGSSLLVRPNTTTEFVIAASLLSG